MENGRKVHAVIIGWACTTLCLVSYTAAFSRGASLSACTDMMPKHMRAQLHSPRNNYVTIHTNMSLFFPGDKVPVTVRSSRDFMGFLLQARKVSNDEIAGTFVFIPPGSKLLTCFEDGDTVTHSDKSLKRNLSFVWKAPDQPIGDIKFFISVVQSYFVYWAKIESAVVAQQVQNKTSADSHKSKPLTPAPLQELTGPQVAGMASRDTTSPTAITNFPQYTNSLPGGLTGMAVTEVLEPGFGVQTDTQPVADPKLLSRTLLSATALAASSRSGGNSNFSGQRLEPSLAFQELRLTSALPSFLFQDYSTSYTTYDGTQSISSTTKTHLCVTCKDSGQVSTENWAVLKTSPYATASRSARHVYTHLLETTVTTAQFGNSDTASNLSSASRQMAERKPTLQSEEAGSRGEEEEEEEVREEVAGNTLASVTRPFPETAIPGKGQDSGRETRLIAAQLGILLVCTTVLGLALAAGLRCIYAQYCHKRTEVSFSEPDNNVITVRENGEMMHFRKIRENSFVLVQAEYNWISPSGSGKKTII
ncbi:reelin domain-containing protein 1 [Rhea pennata]|uniref:reelin domain-containing protein 1 n=1 Tax=Rhea pennata TaxID=8795 RepID=UPI002E268628